MPSVTEILDELSRMRVEHITLRQAFEELRQAVLGKDRDLPAPQSSRQLPRYRCHKIVQAGKIARVVNVQGDWLWLEFEGSYLPEKVSEHWLMTRVSGSINTRADAISLAVGGYFVRYDDGYESWSPVNTFEEGYTLIG